MFGWEFPPHNSGGLGTACFGLTRALASEGVEVIFVLPKKIDVNPGFLKMVFADADRVSVRYIDSPLRPYVTSREYELGMRNGIYGKSLLDEVRRYAALARKIAQEETFDVIHAHDWLSFLAGIEARNVSRKPLVVHVHATEFDRGGGGGVNPDVYAIERFGVHAADKVIAVSNYTRTKLIDHYGANPEKVSVVYNGIDEEDRRALTSTLADLKRGGQKIVLFAGRITLQKGPEYFIRAAKKVLEHDQNVRFVVAGSGDMERQVMMEAAYLGISDKILFAGFLRGDELNAAYQAADLYVLPSVSEPFGITPLEAIMNGTPVLLSKQSGVSEVISHALKVNFWDVDDMAHKILAILAHEPLKSTLTENSRHEVKRLTWKAAARACIEIYQTLICRHL